MIGDIDEQRADGLIIGSAGPFYVALNRPTFYLLAGIFLTMAPVIVFFLRDASRPVQLAVSFGISMETGTLAHIWLERVRGMRGVLPWVVHLAVGLLVFAVIVTLVLGV